MAAALRRGVTGEGVSLLGEPMTYVGDELIERLVGSPALQVYGPQYLTECSYRVEPPGITVHVTVTAYRSPLDAYGALTLPRPYPADVPAGAVDTALATLLAYQETPSRRLIWHGDLVLSLTDGSPTGPASGALVNLEQRLLAALPPASELPVLLTVLPAEGLLVETVRYRKADGFPPAWDGLVLTAQYGQRKLDGKVGVEAEVVLAQAASEDEVRLTLLPAWRDSLRGEGAARALGSLGQEGVCLSNSHGGAVLVARQGTSIVAVRRVVDVRMGEALLRTVVNHIRRPAPAVGTTP